MARTLELKVVGFSDLLNTMIVNGKKVKLKTNKDNTRTCQITADKAEIIIYRTHQFTGKAWFWWSLLFYFISIFGIFDVRQNKRCQVTDCRFNIDLKNDTKATMKILKFEDGGKFAEIECDEPVELINNVQYFDKVAQKRFKIMKRVKIGLFFALVATITLLIVFL